VAELCLGSVNVVLGILGADWTLPADVPAPASGAALAGIEKARLLSE